MNPCLCGNLGSKTKPCICSQGELQRYQRKISGPIIDRIDLYLEVPQVELKKLSDDNITSEKSEDVQKRVINARQIQEKRFSAKGGSASGGENLLTLTNSEMNVRELKKFASLSNSVKQTLEQAATQLDLSARAYHRIIKLARTIADLEEAEDILESHIFEALQYRPKQN